MSGIEDLHTFLAQQEKQVQGRVTWAECKLMIGNQAIGEEEGFNVGSDDGFYDLADDWEKADWKSENITALHNKGAKINPCNCRLNRWHMTLSK